MPTWLPAAAIVGATILVYVPAMRAGFVWDDDLFLTANPMIHAPDGLYRFWCTTDPPDYFPLTSTMLWLEWRLWGTDARGYHVVNILLHAAGAVLLWRVLRRLSVPAAWLAGLIFAVHPVNVESVAWITERKNVLPMVFYLLALLSYLRYEDGGRRRWYAAAIIAFLLGLLAKTSVVMLPVVLLGCAWWRRGKVARRDVRRSAPFFALSLGLGLVTFWYQTYQAIGPAVVRTDGPASRLAIAGQAVWFYLYKALVPVNLCFVYPRWQIGPAHGLAWGLLAALAAVFALLILYRRAWTRAILFALGYYVVSLLPVLGFVNIYFMKYSLVADHWQYFALPGVVALAVGGAAWGIRRFEAPRLTGIAAGVCVAAVLGVLCWRQSATYKDAETLYRATIARNGDCWLAYCNLGTVMESQNRSDEAMGLYQESLRCNPQYAEALNNVGSLLARRGRLPEAAEYLQRALKSEPNRPDARNSLGSVMLLEGKFDDAIVHYRAALNAAPDLVTARCGLGMALAARGHADQAAREYREVLRVNPHLPVLDALFMLRRQPRLADACNNVAWLLATNPSLAEGDPPGAVKLAQAVCQRGVGRRAAYLDTLAAAYANAGRFEQAQAAAREAIQAARAAGQLSLAQQVETRLRLYQDGKAYRQSPAASGPATR